jgi:hypothetical protein
MGQQSPAIRSLLVALAILGALSLGVPAVHRRMLREPPPDPDRSSHAWRTRENTLARAHVFVTPAPEIGALDLTRNPGDPHSFDADEPLTCWYVSKTTSGTSPKFDCRLDDGTVVKVKYGDSPEIAAEVAATRLLAALGFGADHVSRVKRVRCLGCPPSPYRLRRTFEHLFIPRVFDLVTGGDEPREFTNVSVERKLEGRAFEIDEFSGWRLDELAVVTPRLGGATRAEVDALRLMAVLLGHWDNKRDNQRLVCLDQSPDEEPSPAPCERPLLMLHDVGSTFGARSSGYEGWRTSPLWTDEARCTTGMAHLPYGGATFAPVEITEPGRRLLAAKLSELSDRQIRDLFAGAGYGTLSQVSAPDAGAWTQTFLEKVGEIAARRPCVERN